MNATATKVTKTMMVRIFWFYLISYKILINWNNCSNVLTEFFLNTNPFVFIRMYV